MSYVGTRPSQHVGRCLSRPGSSCALCRTEPRKRTFGRRGTFTLQVFRQAGMAGEREREELLRLLGVFFWETPGALVPKVSLETTIQRINSSEHITITSIGPIVGNGCTRIP